MIGFAVVGSPRSGTHWTAEVLTRVGWETPHEPEPIWCEHGGDAGLWRAPTGWAGISSCWLTPHTRSMQAAGVTVVHLVRHPLLVVRSMLGKGMLDPDPETGSLLPFHDFIARHVGANVWAWESPADRALAFWIRWTALADGADLVWTTPPNAADVYALATATALPAPPADSVLAEAARPASNRTEPAAVDVEDLDPWLWSQAAERWSALQADTPPHTTGP